MPWRKVCNVYWNDVTKKFCINYDDKDNHIMDADVPSNHQMHSDIHVVKREGKHLLLHVVGPMHPLGPKGSDI